MSRQSQNWDGVLGIWKPAGWTSHDVVAKVRRLLGVRRIGHTGTLDPAVTGVLPLCIGRATRFVEFLQEMPKSYEAVMRFGIATDTEDGSGNIIAEADASHLTENQMKETLQSFVGEIEQVPPMVSAVKVKGKRLYEYAREGITIERKPRLVTIHALEMLEIRAGIPRPEIRFAVRCSKGTYIRTLCSDIGQKLGVPAVMMSLVRTESAGLRQSDCVRIDEIPGLAASGDLREKLVRADLLLKHLPRVSVSPAEAVAAAQGKPLPARRMTPVPDAPGTWLVDCIDGRFVGIYSLQEGAGMLRPVKVFATTDGE
jgi:tRNA pseudouridine55 synthase